MENIDGALGFKATIDDKDMLTSIKRIENNITGMGDVTKRETSRMDSAFKGLAIGIASAFTFDAALQLRQKLIDVRGQFQAFEAILKNSLGSQEAAAEAMQMLADTASKTPFQLDELTGAYVKLVNQGFKPTREEIVKLGDLASSTGKGFDQLAEAVIDAQTGQFERLREFGIKAEKSGDQVVLTFKGISTEVANTSDAIQKYLVGLGDMQGVKGASEAISGTLVGQVSNLQDAITNMFNELGKSSEGFLSDTISATKFLVENYEQIGKILIQLVATYGAYKAAVITTTVVQAAAAAATKGWTLASQVQYTWLVLVEKAQKLLNATMLTNPWVLAATAIMGAVAALVLFNRNTEQVSERQEKLKSITEDYNKKLTEEKGKLLELTETAKSETNSKEQRIKALNELKKLSGGYLNSLSLENIATAQGAKLLKDYNEQLEKKIVAEGFAAQKTALYQEKAGYLINIQNAQNQLDKLKGDFATDNTLNIKIAVQGKDVAEAALKAVDSQIAEIDKTSEQILSKYKSSPTATPTGTPTVVKAPELDFSQWDEAINKQVSLIDAQVAAMAEGEVDALTDKAQKYIDEFNKLQELIQKAVDNSNSLDDNIGNINADYDSQISALGKSGFSEEEIKRRTDALNEARQQDIDSAKDAAFEQSEIYKKLNDEYVEFTRAAIKERIKLVEKALSDESKLSKEQIKKLKEELKNLQTALSSGSFEAIVDGIRIAVSAINELTGSLEGLSDQTKESITSLTELASSGAESLTAIASEDYASAAASGLNYLIQYYTTLYKLVKELFQVFKNGEPDWAAEERMKKEYEEISSAIGLAIEKMEYYLELISKASGVDKLEAFKTAFTEISAAIQTVVSELDRYNDTFTSMPELLRQLGYIQDIDGVTLIELPKDGDLDEIIQKLIEVNNLAADELRRKIFAGEFTGEDLEKAKEMLASYDKAAEDYAKLLNDYREYLTGTTYESVVNSIIQGFKEGKKSVADFADTLEEVVKNALIRAFAIKALEGPMMAWYDQFASYLEDGILNPRESAEITNSWNQIIKDANAYFEILKTQFPDLFGDITGMSSDLTGAIKGITEETASIIAGQFNTVKIYTADLLGVARESLSIQGKIEQNTSYLKYIRKDIGQIAIDMKKKSPRNDSAL